MFEIVIGHLGMGNDETLCVLERVVNMVGNSSGRTIDTYI